MITEQLFTVGDENVAATTDDWYTPPWVFDAAAVTFDIDVAAPVAPESRTCPARRYFTAADDGLTQPWDGLIWCNPPYSRATPWVDRWAAHPDGLLLLPAMPEVHWQGGLLRAADALTVLAVNFLRPALPPVRLRWAMLLCARGPAATAALARIAAADRYAAGGYMVKPWH